MIKIKRDNPPENTVLDTKKQEALDKIKTLVEQKKLKLEFEKLWSNSKVKDFLYESQNGKCCYCERKRDKKRDSDVEHFRPKAKVKESEEHPGYWWLAYEWKNLLIACKTCNQGYKGTKFPLKNESKRVSSKNGDLNQEKPLLINPLEENPEEFITYDLTKEDPIMIKAIGKCERAKKTINDLTGINDKSVMEERAEKIKSYEDALLLSKLQDDKKYINKYTCSKSQFSGFARFYFKEKGLL